MAQLELKPCPFCGGKAIIMQDNEGFFWIGCNDEYMCIGNINHGAMIFTTEQTAAKAWNRRANNE